MKHKKYLSIAFVALAITSGIAGCSNSASSTQSTTVKATNTETETQNTKDIKAELITRADAVSKKIDEASQKSGWIEPTDFPDIAADLQLLAITVGMEHERLVNDNETLRNKIMDVKKKVSSFSNEEATVANENLKNGNVIYQATLMDDFHNILDEVNLSHSNNNLAALVSMDKSSPESEIIKQAREGIESIETYTYPTIQRIEKNFSKYPNAFSDKEFKLIGESINNLKSSLEKQLKMMKQFDGNTENSELDYEYLLKSATEDYTKAETNIENLESSWNIVYTSK
ncbi:hypothetical protein [Bacillus cereus]|uniref:hypothetical protein n=1 Tax=Bacillus cereus TaxID=1396 RepID=UPI00027ABBCE|nr:hypothetical protein [Bacillus cereus]EJS74572.1 hypothetical protein ICY_03475 [Bacillus cereus BAG2X1-3]